MHLSVLWFQQLADLTPKDGDEHHHTNKNDRQRLGKRVIVARTYIVLRRNLVKASLMSEQNSSLSTSPETDW
jgi:hypothetical protein